MSGIAGVLDLAGQRTVPSGWIQSLERSLLHRGPDGKRVYQNHGIALVGRYLNTQGINESAPDFSHDPSAIQVVFHGELFNHLEIRSHLESRGYSFRNTSNEELLVFLWQEYGDTLFDHLKGQFAFALWDGRHRRLILARDRFGICPLHWSRQGDWLYFGSEIRTLLATGQITPRADLRGINHVFTFFAVPGPLTCFEGIQAVLPGTYLDIARESSGQSTLKVRTYWKVEFPLQGTEEKGQDEKKLVDAFEALMLRAVKNRLQSEVPAASYLSGGIDSGLVTALACKVLGGPLPTFTIKIGDPLLDETSDVGLVAQQLGVSPRIVHCGHEEVLETYPQLVAAAESPIIDTACVGLLLLAREVHCQGLKIGLTGEGADEWLASYPWLRLHKLLTFFDVIPGISLSHFIRKSFLRLTGAPRFPGAVLDRIRSLVGGHNGWLDAYGIMSMSKLRFYSDTMLQVMADNLPYADLELNAQEIKRWHPLNRALKLGARVHLPGLLLNAKGDRIGMLSSVQNRYPFLDEEVFHFLSRLHPDWKLRGLTEKYLLRRLAERWLPKKIAWKRKALFRAPLDGFHQEKTPPFVEELFSEASLRKTGYFNPHSVARWRKEYGEKRPGSTQRTSLEMGLVGVLSTQLWHHLYIDSSLASLPGMTFPRLDASIEKV